MGVNADPLKPTLLRCIAEVAPDLGGAIADIGLCVQSTAPRTESVTLIDTFDGRIHAAGAELRYVRRSGVANVLELRTSMKTGWKSHVATLPRPPGFAAALPPGPLRDRLLKIAGVRRLLAKAVVALETQAHSVRDDMDKAVVNLESNGGRITRLWNGDCTAQVPCDVTVKPLRGYRRESAKVLAALRETGWQEMSSLYASWMNAVGLNPMGAADLPPPELAGTAPSITGVCQVLDQYRNIMIRNEAGTLVSLDSEFLHEFRVAVRRTRSLLSRMKAVFDAQRFAHYKVEFSWLGGLTGPTRDLDVYLINMASYRLGLDDDDIGALAPVERLLNKEQRKEQRKLARGLSSDRYKTLMRDWSAFLEAAPANAADPLARKPLQDVARRVIWRQFKRVHTQGRAIGVSTEADAVHALRIECKKLRYLLEAFGPLFVDKKTRGLVSSLKRLQTNLGDFNDYEVQAKGLRQFALQLDKEGGTSAQTFLVMGRLIERLLGLQANERRTFHGYWDHFDTKTNAALVRAVFGPVVKAQ
ncbi:MAG: CHAD domain-containing protein [Chromatiales bacterium]|jgi:CHAD domain-containing protein|nr:CHAD domain-containing protein [Chromatiales bacterium]